MNSNADLELEDLNDETFEVVKFGELAVKAFYPQYIKQHGGFILNSVYLSNPINEELVPLVEDPNDVFHNLHQVGRSADFHVDAEIDGFDPNEEFLGFWEYTDEFHRLLTSYPVKLLETRDLDDGPPGLHPFGNLVGKIALFRKYWGPEDVNPQLLIRGNLEKFYREKNSDHATRCLYEQFNIDIMQTVPNSSSNDQELRKLPSVRDETTGDRISGQQINMQQEADFPSSDASGEDRILKWYYENCLETGVLFREFSVTNMIEKSNRARSLDGLLIRSDQQEEIYKPTMKNNGYQHAKYLMDCNHPVQAIEVHKWGWEGFGQLLGKSTLLEDFWGVEIVKKVLIVKNNQGRRFERLEPGNPQVDLESIMDEFGIRIVIAPEDI